MTTQELLVNLLKSDIKLWVEGERLHYNAPKGAMTPELQAEIVKRKAEIIAYLKNSQQHADSIKPAERPARIPLSFAQRRLWFLDQLDPGSSAYNMSNAVRLRGNLNVAALEQGLKQIVQRHESLRTTFQAADDEPFQVIAPDLDVTLPLVDLSGLAGSDREREVERLIREEAGRSFDLTTGPLLRCALLKLAPDPATGADEHILLLTMHHIITDGWSMGVFFREVVLLGQAYAGGKESPLPDLPLQFPDFAIWQRDWLQGDVLEKQLAYWKKQLDGAPMALELPTDHPRPAVQTYRGSRLQVNLSNELRDTLQLLSQQEDATLFMTLLAAFQVLLARYSGQTDILVGTPIANRSRIELERIIGFFANTLVIRANLSDNPTFRQALRRVREACLGAYDHQDVPFEKLVDELHLPRDLSRNPIFQVMFILQNAPQANPDLDELSIEPLDTQPDTSQFDLRLSLQEMPAGLTGILEYSTHLFEQATVQKLFEDFRSLLSDIVANPDQPLALKGENDRRIRLTSQQRREDASVYVAPSTLVEQGLVDIWTKVLKVEKIGVHDNFFSLGGDSLLATQVASRLRKTFQVDFPLRTMFELPTVAGLAGWVETARGKKEIPALPLTSAPRNGPWPLSFAQQRLWFIDQLEPGNPAYNIFTVTRLHGQLDVNALTQGFKQVIQRHESLRTTFVFEDEQPQQVIAPTLESTLPLVDLTSLSSAAQEAEAERLAREEALRPFDLSKGPLVRCTLLKLAPGEHILLLTMHHIISDGWSMGVLFREIVLFAQAYAKGQPNPLPELPLQYPDFAVWQRNWLQGDVLNEQLDYWKNQLAGAPVALELPGDHPRPAVQTYRGSRLQISLPKELNEALQALSRQENATLFMTLLTAFQVLLARYSRQSDIVVGSPVANRNRSEIEGLIGFFVNNLVLRSDLSGDPSFREALGRVRKVCLSAYEHQDVPFEKLVDELHVRRDMSRSPLFQVMFILQNTPFDLPDLSALSAETVDIAPQTAQFDLRMSLLERPEGLSGILEYNTDLFEQATIAQMIEHFRQLLTGIVADPGQRLSELLLLPAAEQERILLEWNATQTAYPQDQCLHQRIEAQVQRTPDALAVTFEGQTLTYRALNERANQLAHFLQTKGLGPESLVGICVERSLEMVIGLLGILKAGCAYVPLDPSYPPERLAYMLADSQVSILLTQAHLLDALPEYSAETVCLDRDRDTLIAPQPTEDPARPISPTNLAYMIYTSGSTGKPKGAMNTHLGICNRLLWMQEAYSLTEADRVLQKTPFSFDVSVWEFFWPLMTGARLVVARPEGHKDSAYLMRLIAQEQISTLHFVPSMLRAFLEEPGLEECASLKRVICSGEALPYDLQEKFFARSSAELHNLYGPTEAAVDVTYWDCSKDRERQIVPIGRPIANTQIYILDENLRPVPVGVPGELYIGGLGVGRGYHKRPDLTAERFVPTPPFPPLLGTSPMGGDQGGGGRLYRTGDLTRWLPDGSIEYLGRIDFQVKIHGFRIELGEIENTISQHPDVHQAVVTVRDDHPGKKYIVAYLIVEQNNPPSADDLRSYLRAHLPEYMLPTAFVFLDQLPLNPNGKVDRKALPAPEAQRSEIAHVAPRTEVEEILVNLWKEVLHIDQIGVYDNFFAIGGDSLSSIHMISRAKQAGFQLTLNQFFQHQSIAELAKVVETVSAHPTESHIITTEPGPLAPNQHWFFDQHFFERNRFNLTTLLEVLPPLKLDPVLVKEVVRILLVHHEALRMRFVQEGSRWQQYIVPPDDNTPFDAIDLSTLPEQKQKQIIEMTIGEMQLSLNLSKGPLLRLILFILGDGKPDRLLMIIHHLVTDDFSGAILMQDFMTAYRQLTQAEPVQLPPRTTPFHQWSERLVEYAQSQDVQHELELWQAKPGEKLPGVPPTFYSNPCFIFSTGYQIFGELGSEETNILLQHVLKTYDIQLIELMLATMAETLGQTKGDRSIYVDILRHGRDIPLEHVDLSRTVGWFVIHHPLLLKLDQAESIEEAMPLVKEQYRRPKNGGISYDLLRYMHNNDEMKKTLLPRPLMIFSHEVVQPAVAETFLRPAFDSIQIQNGFSKQILWPYLLELRTIVVNNRLRWVWTSGESVYQRSKIEELSENFGAILKQLIHSMGMTAAGNPSAVDRGSSDPLSL